MRLNVSAQLATRVQLFEDYKLSWLVVHYSQILTNTLQSMDDNDDLGQQSYIPVVASRYQFYNPQMIDLFLAAASILVGIALLNRGRICVHQYKTSGNGSVVFMSKCAFL